MVKFRINRTPCAGSVGMQVAFGRVRRKPRILRIAKYVPQANSLCYKGYVLQANSFLCYRGYVLQANSLCYRATLYINRASKTLHIADGQNISFTNI